MATQSPAERFADLQSKAREAYAEAYAFRAELDRRFQSHSYATRTLQNRLAVLDRAERRHWDRYFKYLTAISPRAWDQIIPCSWIREALTYADAVTDGTLSVVPPAAYGYTQEDSRRFAWPVSARREA